MRAIAVLLVVAFHAGVPAARGGYIGVDVFFVLSGYLITGLLVREIEESGRLDLVHFYARRARRLLPGAALMVAATALTAIWVLPPLEQLQVSQAAGAASVYVSNVYFMLHLGDYVVTGDETNPLLHTWSLAVEEQFYLVWPLAVWLVFRARSRARLAAWMAAVSLASFAFCLWLTELRQPWAFYGSPARGWEFGIGGLAMLLPTRWMTDWPRARGALAWLGMAAVALAAVAFTQAMRFPGVLAALPALGTAALLAAGTGAPGAVHKPLHAPVLQWLGRLSYSWYLWHWPALVFAVFLVPGLGVPGRVLVSAASLAVAALAHAAVEHPVRSNRVLVARPRASLLLAAGLTCASLALVVGWTRGARQQALSPRFRAYTAAAAERARLDCLVPVLDSWRPPCVGGDTASATTVVLFGDSHASQWQPALEQIAQLRGWRLVTLTKPACPAADVEVQYSRLRRVFHECTRWRGLALRYIRELRPAAVVMASAQWYVRPPGQGGVSNAQWRDGTRRTAAALDSLGIQTVLLYDTPTPMLNIPTCLARAVNERRDPERACALPRREAAGHDTRLAERDALRGLRHAMAIDPAPWLCTAGVCEPVRDGRVVYRDNSHITAPYARFLVPELMPGLAQAVERRADTTSVAKPAMARNGMTTQSSWIEARAPGSPHGCPPYDERRPPRGAPP